MTGNSCIYGYLRASTKEQGATKAKNALLHFTSNANLNIDSFLLENESGATLNRPEPRTFLDCLISH